MKKVDTIDKIEIAFSRLIGPLAIMMQLETYSKSYDEINDLFNIVTKWGAKFYNTHDLNFIDSDELLKVYERMDELKDKYLFDTNLGYENELSDEIVIWMYELMELRKALIERK